MSWVLFKANLKNNRFIWILLTSILCFYLMMIITMFDPESTEVMDEMLEMLPKELVSALGFNQFGNTLLTYLAGYIYGFLIFLFPMIVSIVVNHRLIATHVDKGSMTYLLTSPNSRIKIATTQAVYSIVSITAMLTVGTLFTILLSIIIFPGELEIGKFILLNIYTIILYYAIGGIGFFASCFASENKYSLGIGVGVPVGFLVIQMLSQVNENLELFKYLTLYSLFNPDKLIHNEPFAYIAMFILLLIAGTLYTLGIIVFNKKDLYI